MLTYIKKVVLFNILEEIHKKCDDLERGLRGVTSYIVGAEGAMNIMKIILGRELLRKEFSPI
ncbi:MAG TPA: hypothetical protein VMW20_00050 [Candidatus Nanoarchaeia archaeon]|nr:hypothetical protein [Candidatus Nanoarchaeia archaeon]